MSRIVAHITKKELEILQEKHYFMSAEKINENFNYAVKCPNYVGAVYLGDGESLLFLKIVDESPHIQAKSISGGFVGV